jgi:hypothetical protein
MMKVFHHKLLLLFLKLEPYMLTMMPMTMSMTVSMLVTAFLVASVLMSMTFTSAFRKLPGLCIVCTASTAWCG